ncbi:hypothetical protein WBP07_11465 [Novosphingobium sp. BL-8A]|uniref:hypothetical protein n=1 Tax=Novosphingobium sp. BL-8A TaxID=3127639 RepID=UPI003756BB92
MQELPRPTARPLQIFPTDPTRGYSAARTATILVENEILETGPVGARLEVIDYDGHAKVFYDRVNLDDPAILMHGGLTPSESDPRFHQQMVYAVASRTLANFDRALGRRISMRRGKRFDRLRLFPHAFRGKNAFYDRDRHGLLFGYFDADDDDPGANIPKQTVFTCLSHDIIAHEMTHAIVDRLRRYFLEPTNVDVLAFHEGFADIVALLQHFSFRDLLAEEIQRGRGDLRKPTLLVELARQFGFATGSGKALRSALDKPDRKLLDSVVEPHARGSILVAAVFDGFFATYQSRISDLIRIATGGTGELPPGDLAPDLVNRIATEAAKTAQRQLDMCIRAFDYLPPVDITFGDYLRAIVTADFELNPDDEWGQRAALIEGFRQRGIYPAGVGSLAEDTLRWQAALAIPPIRDSFTHLLPQLLQMEAQRFTKLSTDPRVTKLETREIISVEESVDEADEVGAYNPWKDMREALVTWATGNLHALQLTGPPNVASLNAVFRTAPSGALLIELVAQLVETDSATENDPRYGGVPVRGGSTIIVGVDGIVRYVISKPLPGPHLPPEDEVRAVDRVERQERFIDALDDRDPMTPYLCPGQYSTRMKARMSLRALHEGH